MLTGTATGVSLSDGYINNQGQGSSFTYQNIGSYTNSDSSGNATQSSTSGEPHDLKRQRAVLDDRRQRQPVVELVAVVDPRTIAPTRAIRRPRPACSYSETRTGNISTGGTKGLHRRQRRWGHQQLHGLQLQPNQTTATTSGDDGRGDDGRDRGRE